MPDKHGDNMFVGKKKRNWNTENTAHIFTSLTLKWAFSPKIPFHQNMHERKELGRWI